MASRRPNPLAWAVLLGIVLLVVLLLRAAFGGGSDYPPQAKALAADSAKLGREVSSLRSRIGELDRIALIRQLRNWRTAAKDQLDRARTLEPPEDHRIAYGYLVASLGLRAAALGDFEPGINNALSDRDPEVAISNLASVFQDLVSADRTYALFRDAWPDDTKPEETRWVADPDEEAGLGGVSGFVSEIRKQPGLETTYNLKITSVTVTPKPTGEEREVDQLPYASSISVAVVVENDGNQDIPASAVVAILKSERDPRPSTVEGSVGRMRPGDKQSVTLRGLSPTAGGPLNLLTVTVGPIANERNTLDNSIEYKFSMARA